MYFQPLPPEEQAAGPSRLRPGGEGGGQAGAGTSAEASRPHLPPLSPRARLCQRVAGPVRVGSVALPWAYRCSALWPGPSGHDSPAPVASSQRSRAREYPVPSWKPTLDQVAPHCSPRRQAPEGSWKTEGRGLPPIYQGCHPFHLQDGATPLSRAS